MNRRDIEDIYPLSPMQQGMLFHTLYSPASGVYFEQWSNTLCGDLDVSAFERAWQRIVDRHSILRAAFTWEDISEPCQVISKRVKLPLKQYNWIGLSPIELQQRLETYLEKDRVQGFELSQTPLIRLTLIKVADDFYHFIMSFHHMLLDRWSASLIFKEVFTYYKAFHQNQDLHLESSSPYRDYIAWLQQQDISHAELFWRRRLKGFTTPTSLQVDQASNRLPGQEDTYDNQQVRLSMAVTTALQSLARQHRITLNTIVQGAWALLLSRYSGEEDVVFGNTVSGRPADLPGVESMVGLFINTLPVRAQVRSEDTLMPWLKRLHDQMVELLQYEHSSLIEIQGWSEVPRGLPLFESILVFENIPVDGFSQELDGSLEVRCAGSGGGRTNYPLTVAALPGSELSLEIAYDCSRFDDATITRMLGHFRILLEGIVNNPEQHISDLPLLTEAERHQILVEWNDTKTEYPRNKCIHQLFEDQVERTPDAVAVIYEDKQLTYRELNKRANQLARHLQALGVKPESLVGICLERSLEMLVGILGILKAGGGYLPLDLVYPKERLEFMLKDAKVLIIITQQDLLDKLPNSNARTVFLHHENEVLALESIDNLNCNLSPGNLAYVIYTSGSTGKPKGVLVSHYNVARLFQATEVWFNFSKNDVWSFFHSHAFDFSVWEIWGALFYGGKVVVIPYFVSRSPELFHDMLCKEKVTVLNQTPSAFKQLLCLEESIKETRLSSLRYVIFGGEALELQSLKPWFDRYGDENPKLVNMYGITETTVHATFRLIKKEDLTGVKRSVIGVPITDVKLYILNSNLNLQPLNVPGEIYVGGAGVALGYLNRDELTAEKFIKDPFSERPEARLYKTGDRGKLLPGNDIEYLGRFDNQVKIRGFRVELGEIEAVLGQHPAVREAVVLAREDEADDPSASLRTGKRLVAYVVSDKEEEPTISDLRNFLKRKLPDYMIPAFFIFLDDLPLTPGGKVDRMALPAPGLTRAEKDDTFVPPRDEMDSILLKAWEKVLCINPIGNRDNFFDLGGHSLLGVRLVSEIEKTTGISIPLKAIFRFSTVEQMADEIKRNYPSSPEPEIEQGKLLSRWLSPEQYKCMLSVIGGCKQQTVKPGSLMLQMNTDGFKRPLFWCFNSPEAEMQNIAKYLGKDQPVYGLFSGSEALEDRTVGDLKTMANHYIDEILAQKPEGPYFLGGNCGGAKVASEIAVGLRAQGKKVERLCLLEYFDSLLFEYPGKMLLLYGKESNLKAYKQFRWLEPGWSEAFRVVPDVDWVPGAHGQFFNEPNIKELARKVSSFLNNETIRRKG